MAAKTREGADFEAVPGLAFDEAHAASGGGSSSTGTHAVSAVTRRYSHARSADTMCSPWQQLHPAHAGHATSVSVDSWIARRWRSMTSSCSIVGPGTVLGDGRTAVISDEE